jgi:hypothetical protein
MWAGGKPVKSFASAQRGRTLHLRRSISTNNEDAATAKLARDQPQHRERGDIGVMQIVEDDHHGAEKRGMFE